MAAAGVAENGVKIVELPTWLLAISSADPRRRLCRHAVSLHLEVLGRGLAFVRDLFELHLLTLVQGRKAGLFDSRNMDENVLAAACRLNEPITLGRVEPLHGTARHRAVSPVSTSMIPAYRTESKVMGMLFSGIQHSLLPNTLLPSAAQRQALAD
jgi:hypothetical protein